MRNETNTDPLNDWFRKIGTSLSDEDYEAGIRAITAHDAEVAAKAWDEGCAAGRDYQADGRNSNAHDPAEGNPYREGASHE